MNAADAKVLKIVLPADLSVELEKFCREAGCSQNAIAVAALRAYMDEASQIDDIEQGITEADRGEFASVDEVNAFFARYGC